MPKQALFLRVGIDRRWGGRLSPRFEDGSFEWVKAIFKSGTRDAVQMSNFEQKNDEVVLGFHPSTTAL